MDLGLVDSVEDFSLVDGDFGVATADLGGGSGAETWACNDESFEHARTLRRLVAGPCSSTTVLANDGAPVSTTTYAYDGAQRLVSETTAYPDGGNLTYFYLYEDGGGLSELVLVRDDAAVQRTEIEDELDVNRRLLSRTGRSRGVGVDWVTSYFYDESGRILREETDYELNGSVDGWADYRYSEPHRWATRLRPFTTAALERYGATPRLETP